jgi:thiamine transporter
MWMFVGGAGRLACSFVSGIIFFGANAPEGQPVWLYSLVYNLSYIVPSLVVCAGLGALVVPALERAVPTRGEGGR